MLLRLGLTNKNHKKEKVLSWLEFISNKIKQYDSFTPITIGWSDIKYAQLLEDKIDEIDVGLQQLGLTSLINAKKPTPLDEAKNIIYTLRHVYYDAINKINLL